MIRLDLHTRSLKALLSAPFATNPLVVLASYSDRTEYSDQYVSGANIATVVGATAVEVSRPASATIREIDSLSVQNADTAPATITFNYDDNGITYTIFKVVLGVGDLLTYAHGVGWGVVLATGSVKQASASGAGLMTGDSGAGGTAGSCAAPAAGDAAAGKFWKADGTWAVPPGGGGGGGATWTVITANQAAVAGNVGYFCAKVASQLALSLPTTSAVGDTIHASAHNANGWRLTQAAGQKVWIGDNSTATGVTGFVESTGVGDTIEIVCLVANLEWRAVDMDGTLNINF